MDSIRFAPFHHGLDFVVGMFFEHLGEVRVGNDMGDDLLHSFSPSPVSLPEVFHRHFKMLSAGVYAPDHHLIAEHEMAHQGRSIDLQRAVAARNSCQNVNTVDTKGAEQIKLHAGNPGGLEDHVNLSVDVVQCRGPYLAAINIPSAQLLKDAGPQGVRVDDVQPEYLGPSEPERHGSEQSHGAQSGHQNL